MWIGTSPIKVSQNLDILTLVNLVDKKKAVAIGVSTDSTKFRFYKSGILTSCGNSLTMGHAVVVVGYIINHERKEICLDCKEFMGSRMAFERTYLNLYGKEHV